MAAKIHIPDPELGDPEPAATDGSSEDGAEVEAPKPKKKTRRGTRGGRGRKKKTASVAAATAEESPAAEGSEWEYVPMSQWGDQVDG